MTKTFFACTGAAGVIGFAALGLIAGPAVASVGHHAVRRPAARSAEPIRMLASGIVTSPYLGGYELEPAEGITTVSSTFKLPVMTCPAGDNGQIDLGEGVLPSADTDFEPNDDAQAVVNAVCVDGQLVYYGVTRNRGNGDIVAASAGDVMQTRIAETPSGQTIETVNNLTSGLQASVSGATNVADSEIVLGAQQEGLSNLIPKFSRVTFTNVQVGGLDWSQTSPAPTPYALNQDGYYNSTQIVPSNVPAKPSTTFTLTERSYQ